MGLMFTGLARVAKETGYPVYESPLWKGRGNGLMEGCKSIIIHHTAGADRGADYNSYNTVMYGRPGIWGLLSQYGIGRNTGTVYVFGAGKAWHTGEARSSYEENPWAIGIEIENNGLGEPYDPKCYNSAVALAAELVMEFGLSHNDVKGHKEIAVPKGRKPDPTFNMNRFRLDVQKYIENKKKPKPIVQKPDSVKPNQIKTNKEYITMPNITETQLKQLVKDAAQAGAELALSQKTVSWRDSTTDEVKQFSIPDALGYLSVHWSRESKRDAEEAAERKAEAQTTKAPSDAAPDSQPIQA